MNRCCGNGLSYVASILVFVLSFFAITGALKNSCWAQGEGKKVVEGEPFFPDQKGNEWQYRGRIIEGHVDQISDKTFTNVSTVKGEDTIDGLKVTVFHDTNPGDQGPTDSYYVRDAAGIRYYGSKPGTKLEEQIVPYQIIRFPIAVSSSFQQLDRTNLDLGLDLDRDGRSERVDVRAMVTVVGIGPVSVPLGTFEEAVEMEAQMSLEVHLSRSKGLVKGSDRMTAWFVRGVGLVKYFERQTLPMVGNIKQRSIQIIEELEEINFRNALMSGRGSKAAAKGIFTNDALNHELRQVSFPSRFHPHSR